MSSKELRCGEPVPSMDFKPNYPWNKKSSGARIPLIEQVGKWKLEYCNAQVRIKELEELAQLAACENQGWDDDGEELTCKDTLDPDSLRLLGGPCSVCYLKEKLFKKENHES